MSFVDVVEDNYTNHLSVGLLLKWMKLDKLEQNTKVESEHNWDVELKHFDNSTKMQNYHSNLKENVAN